MIGRIVSRYTMLYRDREEGLAAGECVTIQILYRDKRRLDKLGGCVTIRILYPDRRG